MKGFHTNLKVGDLVRYSMNPRQTGLWSVKPEGLAIVLGMASTHYVKLKLSDRAHPICLLTREANLTICNSVAQRDSQ